MDENLKKKKKKTSKNYMEKKKKEKYQSRWIMYQFSN